MGEYQKLYEAILDGDRPSAVSVTEEALAANVEPQRLVYDYMVPAMDEVGRLFDRNEYFVPELLIAARAMKGALELVQPLLREAGVESAGRVAIGTVKGDLHDIGKNLVSYMLEGGGFEVIDLGVDVDPARFVEAVQDGAQVVCLSALLTTTMPSIKTTIDTLTEAGVRDQVKVMIGGAPVTQAYCDEIGADGYGENAGAAVHLARDAVAALRA